MNNSTGSFIPSSPIAGNRPSRRVRKIYIVSYIVYVFFTVTIIASLGIFGYTQYLDSQITAAKQDLVTKQSGFDTSALEEVSTLESRLKQASTIFKGQVSLNTVLTAVEEVVLNSVTITGFDYSDLSQTITLKMTASLPDFNAAVYQRTILNNHPVFAASTIQNISYGNTTEQGTEVVGSNSKVLTFDIVVPLEDATLSTSAPLESYTESYYEEDVTTSTDDVSAEAMDDVTTTTNEL